MYLEKYTQKNITNSVLNTDAMSVLRILRQAAVNETRILVDTGLYLCG
jgi:hypothetical protein